MERITGWHGDPIYICRSAGSGVPYVTSWQHNVIPSAAQAWPSWLLRQVRAYSARRSWFSVADAAVLAEDLGMVSKFQSIRSEDAVTWSWFGTLAVADEQVRAATLGWLYDALDLKATPSLQVRIDQWPRVMHPNAPRSPNGPEIDARIDDPRTALIYIESKWRAKLGSGRGPTAGQLDDQIVLRRDSMRKDPTLADDIHRAYVVLGISNQAQDLDEYVEPADAAEALRPVAVHWMTWTELSQCEVHPHREEFARYLNWKRELDPV